MRVQSAQRHLGERLGNESGIALITVLFLLILMTILGLTMMVSVNSDMMINGYYGNARASYYAADSGLNISRQYLINQVTAAVSSTPCTGWVTGNPGAGCTTAPLNGSTAASTAIANLLAAYGSFANGKLNTSGAVNSWPISFMVLNTAACPSTFVQAAGSPVTTNNAFGQIDSYKFTFNYNLCSIGTSSSLQRSTVTETGSIIVSVQAPANNINTSYAYYGAFIDNYSVCSAPLVPGTFQGPVFTNSALEFENSGAYIFTGKVGQVNPKADYWSGGGCTQSATQPSGFNITYQQGFLEGQTAKALPPNSYSQKYAVLDGIGCGEGTSSCTSNSQPPDPATVTPNPMTTYLKNISGAAYAGTGTTGVYLPYSGTTYGGVPVNGTPEGGGFYVEGSASIVLTPGTDTSGNPTQIYQITQGSTVTTITTNIAANTTTVHSGGTTKTLTGVPVNLITGNAVPSAVLYVNGTITGLTGPGQGLAAIQNNVMVTIAGSSNIDITGDLKYTTEPIQSTYSSDTPIASLNGVTTLPQIIAANDANVLGVYTASGNIVLQSPYSNQNLQVDGSLAAIGGMTTDSTPGQCTSSTCGFLVNGSINTFNNLGGQVQTNIFGANMNTQNTYYDPRFAGVQNFAPPFFPATSDYDVNPPSAPNIYSTQQRTSWSWVPVQ